MPDQGSKRVASRPVDQIETGFPSQDAESQNL